jgi:hypothetical protein
MEEERFVFYKCDCLEQEFTIFGGVTNHFVLGFSLSVHPDIQRNILGILNGIRVKFSQMYTPMNFKIK